MWASLYYFESEKFSKFWEWIKNHFTNAKLCHELSLLIINRFEQTRKFLTSTFNGHSHESDQINAYEIFCFEIVFRAI